MDEKEKANLEVIRKYFDGCNSGDLDTFMRTLTDDVRFEFKAENLTFFTHFILNGSIF